jgi:hypothetical protein
MNACLSRVEEEQQFVETDFDTDDSTHNWNMKCHPLFDLLTGRNIDFKNLDLIRIDFRRNELDLVYPLAEWVNEIGAKRELKRKPTLLVLLKPFEKIDHNSELWTLFSLYRQAFANFSGASIIKPDDPFKCQEECQIILSDL